MAEILRFPDSLKSESAVPVITEKNIQLLSEVGKRLVEGTKGTLQTLLRDLNLQLRRLEVLIASVPDKKTQVHLLHIQTMLLSQVESIAATVKLL